MRTIPNSHADIATYITLTTPYTGACPHSGEPQNGSTIAVRYAPKDRLLELHAVTEWLRPLSTGTEAMDLETVAQCVAVAARAALDVPVVVIASYVLRDGMRVVCTCQC